MLSTAKPGQPSPPLSVIESLGRGFETVSSQASLLLIPMVLDLFLWLGPQLSLEPLVEPVANALDTQLSATEAPDQSRELIHTMLTEAGETMNIFGMLSTFPLGVLSLMVSEPPMLTPIGNTSVIPLNNMSGLVTSVIILNLVGIMLGAVYFVLIAQQVLPEEARWSEPEVISGIWVNWLRLTALAVTIVAALVVILPPTFLLATLLGFLHPMLASIAGFLAIMAVMSVMFFLSFSIHSIVLKGSKVITAIRDSMHLVRSNVQAVSGLLVLAMLMARGLRYLWTLPNSDSWLLLVGVAGHAFVATGLWAATFIFYQDRYRWGHEMHDWIQQQTPRTNQT